MKIVTAHLKGLAPLQFGRPIQSTKNTGEGHDDFEERTWMERLHCDPDGHVFVPPMNIKNCLAETAQYLSESVPGKGKATFTKLFLAGTMVTEPLMLTHNGKPVIKADVVKLRLFVPSDGKRGGGKRVFKNFPVVEKWETIAKIILLDPILKDKPAKVEEYLVHAGQFIGICGFRPRNGGYFGRFEITKFVA